MTMNNNPRIWNKLLENSPVGSVLMGGAIRDWYAQCNAKDFDIFYPYHVGIPVTPANWEFIPRDVEDEAKHVADYDIATIDGSYPIGCVYDYRVPVFDLFGNIVKVQLIGVHYADPRQHFSNFDHTLTLGFYGKEGLFIDRKLTDSINSKTVTCTNKSKPVKSLLRAKSIVDRVFPYSAPTWNYEGFEVVEEGEVAAQGLNF